MTISSPGFALFTAACIDYPGWTKISAAVPVLEPNVKIRKANAKVMNMFI